jgi:hypothetical protein
LWIEALASLLSAMFERAALDVAAGTDPDVVLDVVRDELSGLVADKQTGRDQ